MPVSPRACSESPEELTFLASAASAFVEVLALENVVQGAPLAIMPGAFAVVDVDVRLEKVEQGAPAKAIVGVVAVDVLLDSKFEENDEQGAPKATTGAGNISLGKG